MEINGLIFSMFYFKSVHSYVILDQNVSACVLACVRV